MSLTVNQRPNQNNNWVASGNPIVYKMQRKDFAVSTITNTGGALQITVTSNLATLTTAQGGPVIAGSILYYKSAAAIYDGFFTVVSCSNAANSIVVFTAGTYTSGAGADTGYINLEQRLLYRCFIEVWKSPAATLLFSGIYSSPTIKGVLQFSVSSVIKAYIYNEVMAVLSLSNVTQSPKVKQNLLNSLGAYIKYTETWSGSAETIVDDVANPFFAVSAAMQVGDLYGSYLKLYSEPNATPTRKFLNKFTNPNIWTARKFSLSYIDSDVSTTNRTLIKKTRCDINGVITLATYDLPEVSGSLNKSVYEVIEDLTSTYALIYDKQNGGGTAWTNLGAVTQPTVTLAVATSSQTLYFPLQLILSQTYSLDLNFTITGTVGAETVTFTVTAFTLAGTIRQTVVTSSFNVGTNTANIAMVLPATSDTYFVGVSMTCSAGVNSRTCVMNYLRLNNMSLVNKVIYQIVTLTSTIAATETVVSESLVCNVKDPCDNVIQLFWKNTLGGDQTWCFDYSQDYTITPDKAGKVKRYLCQAFDLSLNQFETLDELNTIGETYSIPITELVSTTIRTTGQVGQSVYTVDANGNKIGVIVLATQSRTRTKQVKSRIDVTIELPETFIQ